MVLFQFPGRLNMSDGVAENHDTDDDLPLNRFRMPEKPFGAASPLASSSPHATHTLLKVTTQPL